MNFRQILYRQKNRALWGYFLLPDHTDRDYSNWWTPKIYDEWGARCCIFEASQDAPVTFFISKTTSVLADRRANKIRKGYVPIGELQLSAYFPEFMQEYDMFRLYNTLAGRK